jgi:glycosyltransferase involved in cell wall biosynthesis
VKILFITPQLPFTPRQGTQIRNYYLLKAAATAHEVDLLSFARPDEGLGIEPHFETWKYRSDEALGLCHKVETVPIPSRGTTSRLKTLFTSLEPDLARRLASREFDAALKSLLNRHRYDVVQVEGLEMARYIPTVIAAAPGTPIVFDDHNVEYLLQLRTAAVDARHVLSWPKALYSGVQWLKLKRYERLVCRSSNVVLAVSQLDAKALSELGAAGPVTVVPNCIDVGYYRRNPSTARDPATILFTGTMDYRPNVDAVRWFALEILPRVAARKPHVRFRIVGRSPTTAVMDLAHHHPAVEVVGAVEDIRPYLFHSTLCVVPIRMAGGARLKILEALAAELPVVSTSMGAEGIDSISGQGVLLADIPEDFAASILRLMDDQELNQQMGLAGRQVVEQKYDWKQIAPRLLGVYDAIRKK